jgi:hypothetical protein
MRLRVIDAQVTVMTSAGVRIVGHYRLATTITTRTSAIPRAS